MLAVKLRGVSSLWIYLIFKALYKYIHIVPLECAAMFSAQKRWDNELLCFLMTGENSYFKIKIQIT